MQGQRAWVSENTCEKNFFFIESQLLHFGLQEIWITLPRCIEKSKTVKYFVATSLVLANAFNLIQPEASS